MITRDYMLAEPPPPSRLKVTWDLQAMPMLIDAAASVERQVENVLGTVRRVPVTCVLIAAGLGFLAAHVGQARS